MIIDPRNLFRFGGRGTRREFIVFISAAIATLFYSTLNTEGTVSLLLFALSGLIVSGATSRRLHDLDKSGGFAFVFLVPIIGQFLYGWMMLGDGTIGPNRYGKDPRGRSVGERLGKTVRDGLPEFER